MPLVPLRALLDHAAENGYGLAAINVNNMEQVQAVVAAANETESPAIIQATGGARTYSQDLFLRNLIQAAVELYPHLPIAWHQDHGSSPEKCFSAIELGYTSVMMDGSLEADGKTPASFDYNADVTCQVVNYAHARGVTVEAELGCLGGIEDGHGAGLTGEAARQHLTDPDQAEQFVTQTGVDALAVAIGTSHGAYKFTSKPTGDVLVMSLIEEIHRRLPNTHLVMHGASSVPQHLLERIRQFGGDMKPTYGVPTEEIQRGIRNGVRKINVDTDNRLAITAAIREVFATKKGEFDPRKYLGLARDAMKQVCIDRMVAFGQAGHAGKIATPTCRQMIDFYQKASADMAFASST